MDVAPKVQNARLAYRCYVLGSHLGAGEACKNPRGRLSYITVVWARYVFMR